MELQKNNVFIFDKSKSIYLEIYRGIAAFGVAICHFLAANGSLEGEFVAVLFVEMFFPLSGFILAPQVLRIYRERRSLPIFLMRRWMRTIPLYMLGLFCIAAMTYNLSSPEFNKYLFFYNFLNIDYLTNNFYPVSWSLAVEEYYYIIFPLFLFFLPIKNLVNKTLLFIGVGLLIKISMVFFFPASFIRIATYSRIDAIGIGFLLYLVMDKCRIVHLYATAIVFFAASIAYNVWHNAFNVIAFVYSANLFFGIACALLYCAEQKKPCSNSIFRDFSTLFGGVSYSVYVFHIAVLGIAMKAGIKLIPYIFLVFVTSYILHRFFEHPLMMMRPKYKQTKQPSEVTNNLKEYLHGAN